MLDWIIETICDLAGDLFEAGVDAVSEVDWSSVISGVISTGLLVAATITVASITEEAIRSQLRSRQELRNKGVTSAVIQDFIQQSGYTEVTLAALNAQNKQVGTFKMRASSASGVKKGDKISI